MLERFKKTPPLEEEPKADSLADVVTDAQAEIDAKNESDWNEGERDEAKSLWTSDRLANQDVSDSSTQDGSIGPEVKVPGTHEFKAALQREHDVLMGRIDSLTQEVKDNVTKREELKRRELEMAQEAKSIKQRLEAIKVMMKVYDGGLQ